MGQCHESLPLKLMLPSKKISWTPTGPSDILANLLATLCNWKWQYGSLILNDQHHNSNLEGQKWHQWLHQTSTHMSPMPHNENPWMCNQLASTPINVVSNYPLCDGKNKEEEKGSPRGFSWLEKKTSSYDVFRKSTACFNLTVNPTPVSQHANCCVKANWPFFIWVDVHQRPTLSLLFFLHSDKSVDTD